MMRLRVSLFIGKVPFWMWFFEYYLAVRAQLAYKRVVCHFVTLCNCIRTCLPARAPKGYPACASPAPYAGRCTAGKGDCSCQGVLCVLAGVGQAITLRMCHGLDMGYPAEADNTATRAPGPSVVPHRNTSDHPSLQQQRCPLCRGALALALLSC